MRLLADLALLSVLAAGVAFPVGMLWLFRVNARGQARYRARMRSNYEAATGMSYPDRNGRTHRLYTADPWKEVA